MCNIRPIIHTTIKIKQFLPIKIYMHFISHFTVVRKVNRGVGWWDVNINTQHR